MDDGGIVLGLDPVIVRAGPVWIRWFGVFVALGLAAGILLALREARRRGLSEDRFFTAAVWALAAGVVGARVLHVLDKLDYYLQNPTQALGLDQSGMSAWGGILFGLAAAWLYSRRRLPFGRLLDCAAPGLLLGLAVGRIGSLINGESWGAPTSLPWGIVYTQPDAKLPPQDFGLPTHPYPAYELLWDLAVFALVWRLRGRRLADGALAVVALALYAAGRLALGFVREEGAVVLGLQQAQVISVVVGLIALPALVYLLLTPAEKPG